MSNHQTLGDCRCHDCNQYRIWRDQFYQMRLKAAITEAPPEPPAHRLEDETWRTLHHWTYIEAADTYEIVCKSPGTDARRWPQRAKRICAGQEALKLLERLEAQNWCCCTQPGEVKSILSMLKEDR